MDPPKQVILSCPRFYFQKLESIFFFFQGVMVAHATLFIVHQKVAKGGDINSPHDRPLGLYGTKQTINSFLLLQT